MHKGILVKYKGGISKLFNQEEEWIEYEPHLSLEGLLTKVFQSHHIDEKNQIINQQSVLLTLNGTFIPLFEAGKTMLQAGDVIFLFPTIAGG